MNGLFIQSVLAAWMWVCLTTASLADNPAAAPLESWRQTYRSIAESIEMRRGEQLLALRQDPLLYYTNPVRATDQNGAIFLWTDQNRPAVFASIWSSEHRTDPGVRNVTHEWHSLLESSDVGASRGGEPLWTSGEPGVAWQTLGNNPAPAASRPARLIQMRDLMRRLRAEIHKDGESELRLMTRPLYRYPESAEGAIDGALFVFGMATDSELIALVEAREQNIPTWSVAFARFGAARMTVKDGERTIWECGLATPYQAKGKYYLMWRAQQMPAEPATEAAP